MLRIGAAPPARNRVLSSASHSGKAIVKPCAGNPHARFERGFCPFRSLKGQNLPMFDVSLLAPETIRPHKRSEYERLVEMGVFEGERVELLYGMLVRMSPQGGMHAQAVAWLHEMLVLALNGQA